MKNIVSKILLIVAVVLGSLWALYPPQEKIRLGKDLRGGVSLLYVVRIPDDEPDPAGMITQVISVLKERVNPQGVIDISFQPQGRDRIEIVMPLPTPELQERRQQFDEARQSLLAQAQIKAEELDDALADGTAVSRFGGGGERLELVTRVQQAFDAQRQAEQDLDAARQAGATQEQLGPKEQAVADAELAFEDARDTLLRLSLDDRRLRSVLSLPSAPKVDRKTGKPMPGSSPRDEALAKVRQDFAGIDFEPVVQAYDAFQAKRTGLDDVEDLIRLLRGAGVLEFYIAARYSDAAKPVDVEDLRRQLAERGSENTDSPYARWFPINDLKQWYEVDKPKQLEALQADPVAYFAQRDLVAATKDGQYYLLLYTGPAKSMTHGGGSEWQIERSYLTSDERGFPAVAFNLDQEGGSLMSQLTGPHVNHPMAIVLDGQVYTAPNLLSRIADRGTIQGTFSPAELNYLLRVLGAGALQARLSPDPIAINTIGPTLGKDNLLRGLEACTLSIIITAALMVGYYFFAGMVALVALLINALLIFGVLAFLQGTFTLPGLAGMALSISMAVDANVLIYERVREEVMNNREDLRTAIRLGYQRALSAIVDGNLTNLWVCIVLFVLATTEVKGFALTMGWGVMATLFTALVVTRVIFAICTEKLGVRSLPMLPSVFPAIHRALQPRINWIALRPVFITISLIAVVTSIVLVSMRGNLLLDTEFRGGVSATLRLREGVELSRASVEQSVRSLAEEAGPSKPALYELRNASVLALGESVLRDGQIYAPQYQIKVASPPGISDERVITDEIVDAIVSRFADELDATRPLTFLGAGSDDFLHHTHPISRRTLGEVIGRPEYLQSVRDMSGGVAVVIDQLDPPTTPIDIEQRIKVMRDQPDFSDVSSRITRVVGLEPAESGHPVGTYRSVAVLVSDPDINFQKVDSATFERRMERTEWRLISHALQRASGLEQVNSFSSSVAQTLEANAIVAVILSLVGMLVYIWVRFGSLRYSVATVAALAHNVTICLGALAATHLLAGTAFASLIRLDEFRIDLNVIAALLTIIGYSINDTIVILDRVRENRGKRVFASPQTVNDSINQTFSRTILTGGSTILASLVLYWIGGPGLQPFAFTFFIGLVVGTYSSVVIAAPLVVSTAPVPDVAPPQPPLTKQPTPRVA